MLSERQLQRVLRVFETRMQGVTDKYITLMGQHIRDIGKLTPSDVNRLIQLKRTNANVEKIKREIAKAIGVSIGDIEKVFSAAAESDMRFAAEVFASAHAMTVKGNKPLERLLKAQLRITRQALANLSQTTLIPDSYRNAVDVAIQAAQSGVVDYNTAVRQALKQAAVDGLRVEYPNSGITRRLDSAVRMNVLDGIRAINRDMMEQVGKEFKSDGIELSAHALCAEDHLPYQGLQMSNKEFDRLQNRLDRPFGMWNCKHNWWPILLGITKPAHSKEELRHLAEYSNELVTIDGRTKTRYQWTQEQRRIETAIRYQKDAANLYKVSGDTVGRRAAQATINGLRDKYSQISEKAGLREQPERMAVSGFRAVKAADQLKKPLESGIIEMWRKTHNTGVFYHLPERMSKKHIRQVAKETGIDLKGITLFIDTDKEKLKPAFLFSGRADPENIGRIDFFPKAFQSREELVRTIFHEIQHVRQYKEFGAVFVQNNRRYYEDITEKLEDEFAEKLKKEGLL